MSGGPADLPALLEEVRDMADRGGIFTIMMTIVQVVIRNEVWDMADRLRPFCKRLLCSMFNEQTCTRFTRLFGRSVVCHHTQNTL